MNKIKLGLWIKFKKNGNMDKILKKNCNMDTI